MDNVAVWAIALRDETQSFWAFEVVLGIQLIAEIDRRHVARQVPVNSRLGWRV